ncbi:MAG: hydroxylamine reductase [Deferribacterota bacterium]|nr:hydroxylamine reductase [Deferribacterota bacterium]
MFCNQCQETLNNQGCTTKGVCGKSSVVSDLQDLLIYLLEGISLLLNEESSTEILKKYGPFMTNALFTTITNANFSEESILNYIEEAVKIKKELLEKYKPTVDKNLDDIASWLPQSKNDIYIKASDINNSFREIDDVVSLKNLILYGIKGLSAYTDHAHVLGFEDINIYKFIIKGLTSVIKENNIDKLLELVLETGETAVKAMELLDRANTTSFGHPEITNVNIGVGNKPGILISGHDLLDLYELLEQTKDEDIHIYTHCEMLPAHYYPKLKAYKHLYGNYGSSWWKQSKEFETFNGVILMTTNCITPVKDSYKNRIFTTGAAGYPGVNHIKDREKGKQKDFSEIINLAKKCPPPTPIEDGFITGGFAHNQVLQLKDKIIEALEKGKIKKFVVMAGCDGRQKKREYYTDIAKSLPNDTVILTAGCAKYRYNKLKLDDIDGIPRVLDAGQCNDSYSLALIALKLKEIFNLTDINELPIAYDIAWYEQKAVTVLLALLYLGVKDIILGPTLPGFINSNITNIIAEKFNLKPINTVEKDLQYITQ